MENHRTSDAVELMRQFADRTGLTSDQRPRRYLWTDAFAVCNFLGLKDATGNATYDELALRLIAQVHHDLGRHRGDDVRTGWISGLSAAEGERHPTVGGLRIGKALRERTEEEPLDPTLEWDRDGQYFHYLTRWMHALDQAARAMARPTFNLWARELAETAHRAFVRGPRGDRRMVWKLSIDLSRPLVPSMGQHDPLEGLVMCAQLENTAIQLATTEGPSLAAATADFTEMLGRAPLMTTDPLGLGGLLIDACRLVQLERGYGDVIVSVLAAASAGLRGYLAEPDLHAPATRRVAFRELGLAIGLAALSMLDSELVRRVDASVRYGLAQVAPFFPLRKEIEAFWLRPEHRRLATWLDHEDINEVMLATSLAPEGFLLVSPPRRANPRAAAPQRHP